MVDVASLGGASPDMEGVGLAYDKGLADTVPVNQQPVRPADEVARSIGDHITMGPAASFAAAVGTVGTSLGLVEQNTYEQFLQNLSPQLYDYYSDYRPAVQLAGDIGMSFLPGTLAMRAIQGGSWLYRLAQAEKLPYLAKVFTSADRGKSLQRAFVQRDLALAKEGAVSRANLLNDTSRMAIGKELLRNNVGDALKSAAAFELGVYGTMNNSDVLFPEEFDAVDGLVYAGLGFALPASVEILATRAFMRNSARQVASVAHEAGVTNPFTSNQYAINPETLTVVKTGNDTGLPVDQVQVRPGDWSVGFSILKTASETAKQKANEVLGSEGQYARNLNNNAQSMDARSREILEKFGTKGVKDVMPAGASDTSLATVMKATETDPLSFLGVRAVSDAQSKAAVTEVLDAKDIKLQKLGADIKEATDFLADVAAVTKSPAKASLFKADLDRLALEKKVLEETDFFVLDGRGGYTPAKQFTPGYANVADKFPIKLEKEPLADRTLYTIRGLTDPNMKGSKSLDLGVDDSFQFAVGSKQKTLTDLDGKPLNFIVDPELSGVTDFTAMQALFDRAIERHVPGSKTIYAHPDMHFLQFDALHDLVTRKPDAAKDIKFLGYDTIPNSQFANGLEPSPEFFEFQSLSRKYQKFNQLMDQMESPVKASGSLSFPDIRKMLNLPAPHWAEDGSGVERLFAALRMEGQSELSFTMRSSWRANYDDLRAQVVMQEFVPDSQITNPDVLNNLKRGIALTGTGITPPKLGGKLLPEVLVARQNLARESLNKQALWDAAVSRNTELLIEGTNLTTKGSILVGPVFDNIIGNAAYVEARKITEATQAGIASAGTVATQQFAVRGNPFLQAAHVIQTDVEKLIQRVQGEIFRRPNQLVQEAGKPPITHLQVFQNLRNPANATDAFDFGRFTTMSRYKWDLAADVHKNTDGTYSFKLADTKNNRMKLARFHNHEVADASGLMAPDPASLGVYKPLAITERAAQGAVAIQDAGRVLRQEQNHMFGLMKRPELNDRNWWVPPLNFSKRNIAYVYDPGSDDIVQTLVGRTPADLEKKIAEAMPDISKSGRMIVDQSTVENYYDAHSRAFFNMLDSADPVTQLGKKAQGSAAQPGVEAGVQVLDDIIDSLTWQMNRVGKRTTALAFEPQIAYAKMMQEASGWSKSQGTMKNPSVWDQYYHTLMGNSITAQFGKTEVGTFYKSVESLYDRTMLALYDKTEGQGVRGALSSKWRSMLGLDTKEAKRIQEQLGPHAPYQKTEEFIKNRLNIKPPATMASHMAELNNITSTLTLRLFELGHPLLNMTGVVATMPAVINALKRRPDENQTAWASRIRMFGMPIGSDGLASISSPKLMANAASYGFTAEGKKHWEFAAANGYLRQYVNDTQQALAEAHGTWTQSRIRKFINGASYLSDKSEEYARGWAHMAGVLIAQSNGVQNMRHQHSFAHQFANDVIGDYRAANRPQIFQGAVGMPLGLFQTYMWNYYQRLFGYVENKQFRALTTQYAMQGSVFGLESVPGWQQFNGFFASAEDGDVNPHDGLYRRLGPEAADWLMHGTISNVPKLFGSDGIAIYSRGDANMRQVPAAFGNVANMPVVNLIENVAGIVSNTAKTFQAEGQYSNQRMLEILGTYQVSRPFSRLLEVASGYSVDRRGQVISDDVTSGLSIAARIMGMRPMAEEKQLSAMSDIKGIELSQMARRADVRDRIQAAIRGDSVDSDMIHSALLDYYRYGGKPEMFPAFIRDAYLTAKMPKARAKLLEELRRGDLNDVQRLFAADVLGPE